LSGDPNHQRNQPAPQAAPAAAAAAPATTTVGVTTARNAVAIVFALNGFVTATWISRIPAVRSTLDLSPGHLGLLLLCPAVGSVLSLPLAGHVVMRLGARLSLRIFAVVCIGGVALAGIGVTAKVIPLVALGLFAYGLGTGTYDVAMNVEGAAVERLLGRSIMPRFHAGWSLGTVAGALVGAGAAALGISVVLHLVVLCALILVATQVVCRWLLDVAPEDETEPPPPRAALTAWTERRTLLIGLVTLCAALAEGVANDWFGLVLVDGYHQSQSIGALGFGVFVAMMTIGRTGGTKIIDRYGRVLTLRLAAGTAALGVVLVVFGHWVPIALVGGLLWGAGTALGFPMGMSAAADDPVWAAPRVSVVASIGYLAFLAGPPLVGFVGDAVGVRRAVAVVLVGLVLIAVLAPVERPLVVGLGGEPATPSGSGDGSLTS
jgi:MFS family permease